MLIAGTKEQVLKILRLMVEEERFEKISALHGLSDEQLGIKMRMNVKPVKSVDSIVKKHNATHLFDNVSMKDFKESK